jgi:hypothetical protein
MKPVIRRRIFFTLIAVLLIGFWAWYGETEEEMKKRERMQYLSQEFGKYCMDEFRSQTDICVFNNFDGFLEEFYPEDYKQK